MDYRRMGRTGLQVSALCLGTMTFGWSADEATSFAIMDRALDGGINFFDTADIYSHWIKGNQGGESETIIGKWLRGKPRHAVVIATKARGPMWAGANGQGLSRAHLMKAAEDSLRRLGTDYIDLYQAHYPDDETPLDETLAALDQLTRDGKVRYLGVSNYPAWQLMKALWISDVKRLARFDCIQPNYSLLHRAEYERELAAACLDQGIGVIPYSPLAAGFLTGKYTRENREPETSRAESGTIKRLKQDEGAFVVVDEARRVAAEHGVPVAQIALAWMLQQPGITSPIIGARTVEQLEEVIGAVDVRLTAAEIAALNAVSASY